MVGDQTAAPMKLDPSTVAPELLVAHLEQRWSYRVGRYFEALISFWLSQCRGLEMLGESIQVRDDERTIGEVDFLFRSSDGEVCHWEAAVKFFLHHEGGQGSHFPGPNAADNFERKATRLFGHQLPLSVVHFPEVSRREAFVKGGLFLHQSESATPRLPDRMGKHCVMGIWFRAGEDMPVVWERRVGHVVAKPHWLGSMVVGEGDSPDLLPLAELVDRIRRQLTGSSSPVLISVRCPDTWVEEQRCFIVSDDWPLRS